MLKLIIGCALVAASLASGFWDNEVKQDYSKNTLEMAQGIPYEGRTFTVDYQNDSFSMDGKPFRFVSGSLHYFRVPHQYWRDRLRKLRAAGLNAVATYVEWSHHNPLPNIYKWEGDANLEEFIRLAVEEDLYVILRPGPYICAERDFGGHPWWLLSKYFEEDPAKMIKPRTTDERYMEESRKWLDVLLAKMKPYFYGNGGPIIMVQVENEYGSYACDTVYKNALTDIFKKHVDNKALLYTTDGSSVNLATCGKIQDAYCTIDFGSGANLDNVWATQRKVEPHGPLVNSEFYPGWLTHWGEKHAHVSTENVVKTLKGMLANSSANVNFFMFYGGTNFGYTNGANHDGVSYNPQITSYDYDAPISEAGDPTEKYYAIREAIGEFLSLPSLPLPTAAPKGEYGRITMGPAVAMLEKNSRLRDGELASEKPLSFEQMWQNGGFVLYHTQLQETKSANLSVPQLKDRAYVYLDQRLIGILDRHTNKYSLELNATKSSSLEFLVENQGRINYGSITAEYKGLNWPVTWGDKELTGWINIGIPLENGLKEYSANPSSFSTRSTRGKLLDGPVGYETNFDLPANHEGPIRDTFLDMTGWGKGVAFINGHNLGRYWPSVGPQVTLYVPGVFLKRTENLLEIFELESAPNDLAVSLIKEHILDIPTKV